MISHPEVIQVGDVLYGFCHGAFAGAWGPFRVEAVGRDWIVCRDEHGQVHTAVAASGDIHRNLADCLDRDAEIYGPPRRT